MSITRLSFATALTFLLACLSLTAAAMARDAPSELVLVDEGRSLAPIVIFEGAPPMTRASADDLADYIEKASGVRPAILEGKPSPLPDHAIWVGYQPVLKELFPDIDFDFKQPEEILLAANGKHLVIVGRDRWDPAHMDAIGRGNRTIHGIQQEYGTANAVYTFLQDRLGVRWFWPGPGGEDVPAARRIALKPFTYRYHPQYRQRSTVLRMSEPRWSGSFDANSGRWTRLQRMQLDSLHAPGGHGFADWWDRFHETHPEYFALQPDGGRDGTQRGEDARKVKNCVSNPALWDQWVRDAAAALEKNPDQHVFNGSPNDGFNRGHCVCENCRAWDNPDAQKLRVQWRGSGSQLWPALSDRYVTLANMLSRRLNERFPDRDDLYVMAMAYGNARPAPVAAKPDEHVIISGVHNFHLSGGEARQDAMAQMKAWAAVAPKQVWRPNITQLTRIGLPIIAMNQVIEDFRFAADQHCIGLFIDTTWEHWATQGPQYYMQAQMIWNPYQDGQAVLEDYYHRAFGPAYEPMKAYWSRLEAIYQQVANTPGLSMVYDMGYLYSPEVLAELKALLDDAQARVADGPQGFKDRVAFVRVGYDYLCKLVEVRALMTPFEAGGSQDAQLRKQMEAIWEDIQALCEAHPAALRSQLIGKGTPMRLLGFHPNHPASPRSIRNANVGMGFANANARKGLANQPQKSVTTTAREAGWTLAFEDDFNRADLGDAWQPLHGSWKIEDGQLVGAGILLSTRGFPGGDSIGFQRMEFEAATAFPAGFEASVPCDISPILQARTPVKGQHGWATGYLFQFGGRNNTVNALQRKGKSIVLDRTGRTLIEPGRTYHIVVENDEGVARLIVDGKLVYEHREEMSLMGEGQDRLGFYFETPARVNHVKVYVKKLAGGLDLD